MSESNVGSHDGATNASPPLTRALALARKRADLETLKGSTNEDSQDIEMDIGAEILLQPPLTDKEAGQALLQGSQKII